MQLKGEDFGFDSRVCVSNLTSLVQTRSIDEGGTTGVVAEATSHAQYAAAVQVQHIREVFFQRLLTQRLAA